MGIKPIKSRHFIRDITIVTLILSAAVIAPIAYLSSQARRNISEQYIDNATAAAVSEFRTMADAMKLSLELIRDWGGSELMPLSDSDSINKLFFPLLEREKILYGISIADMDGGSYYIRHDGKNFKTIEIDANSAPRQSHDRLWDITRQVISDEKNPSDYDPRQRPWFAPALSGETVFWTEPYKFYSSSGSVGITASLSYPKKNGQLVVVALDILLDDLYLGIHKMAPSEHSRVFIFRRDSKLYIPKSEQSAPDFLSFSAVQDELIRKAHSIWSGAEIAEGNAISIRHDNTVWWCGFEPLDNLRRDAWISVMVPESDIISDISQRRLTLWLIGIVAILCCAGMTFWMVHRYGRPASSNSLFDPNEPVGSVLRVISAGESRTVEFKSTMRMNLHTGKHGKEIEIAWLKGVAAFLNTDGGTLLIGVTDDGEITGLVHDDFKNEDKCQLHFKNLVAAHIGAEFSKNIRFIIVNVDDKQIGVISCEPSSEPVFLKHPKGESFFIRSGPSSDELPVSKALEYIKHRKK